MPKLRVARDFVGCKAKLVKTIQMANQIDSLRGKSDGCGTAKKTMWDKESETDRLAFAMFTG